MVIVHSCSYGCVFLSPLAGKGTFGVVLQARAEDIVKFTPQRNIVAVKTPRSMCVNYSKSNVGLLVVGKL